MHGGKFIRSRPGIWAALACTGVIMAAAGGLGRNTYRIIDGDRIFTYDSFRRDPVAVVGEAGLCLDPGDRILREETAGGEVLQVQRSVGVIVRCRGELRQADSLGETVGELLARLDMIPGDRDVLSHSPDTPVTEGMEIRLDSLTEETQTYTACIPHTTRYCGDASLPEGVEEVRIPGRDGQLRCTARVTYVNGEERDREITEQVVTSAPVEEVIVRGTGTTERDAPALAIGENTITLPTGEVLTYTHTAQVRATAYSHLDEGCDFITATGTRVRIGTVAVDPRFIPYGTRMFIVSNDGTYEYGISVAEDCGGAIKGDRVDLYFPTYSDCMAFGRRNCTVYFLG